MNLEKTNDLYRKQNARVFNNNLIDFQQQTVIAEEPKRAVNELQAVPAQTQQSKDDNCFTSALSLFCGALLKDVQETVPPPSESGPLNANSTETQGEGFSKDICRSMVSMLDADKSGKLGFQEFKKLWESIKQWKQVWSIYDTDKSGSFSGFELREALTSAGYKVNSRILNALMHRFGNKFGQLDFDDFMMCSIKLKTMIDIYKDKDTEGKNTASFTLEDWLETTIYS